MTTTPGEPEPEDDPEAKDPPAKPGQAGKRRPLTAYEVLGIDQGMIEKMNAVARDLAQASAMASLQMRIPAQELSVGLATVRAQVDDAVRRLSQDTTMAKGIAAIQRQAIEFGKVRDQVSVSLGQLAQAGVAGPLEHSLARLVPLDVGIIERIAAPAEELSVDELAEGVILEAERLVSGLTEQETAELLSVADGLTEEPARGLVEALGSRAKAWWDRATKLDRLLFAWTGTFVVMVLFACIVGIGQPSEGPSAKLIDDATGATVAAAGAAMFEGDRRRGPEHRDGPPTFESPQ